MHANACCSHKTVKSKLNVTTLTDFTFVICTIAAPMTAITRTIPVDTKSFTVNWEVTDSSHKYIITWTNLLTGVKENVTVAENTNEYKVTGLSGIDNYDVTVTAINSCGVMMSDPVTVYGKIVNMSMHMLIKNHMIRSCDDCNYI